jgi:hypothetical protein
MRRSLLAVLTAALLLGLASPAMAHPGVDLADVMPTDLTHASTDNVEYLGRFPEHFGTAGGRLSEDGTRFYLTDPRGVYVYDVTTPETPTLLGSIALYQTETGAALAQEDPDTNGEILLVDAATSPFGTPQLQVVDVSDPTDLTVISTVPVIDHTWTCVSGIDAEGEQNACAYAYGRTGHIIDLTDPHDAKLHPTTWRAAIDHGNRSNSPYVHDLTEIRPGLVMTAGAAAILMDTSDPTQPVRLAEIFTPGRFSSLGYHSVVWANEGRDPFVVLGTEIAPPPGTGGISAASDCAGANSVIEIWDARDVVAAVDAYEAGEITAAEVQTTEFTRLDSYDAAGRGIFLTGGAVGNTLYCAHWMELHPAFDGGGLMVASYYDRGTRFVQIGEDGIAEEIGWLTAAEGYSGSAQWITEDIAYVMDYRRGLEVVRLLDQPATGVRNAQPDAILAGSRVVPQSALDLRLGSGLAFGLLLLGLVAVDRRRRRAVR